MGHQFRIWAATSPRNVSQRIASTPPDFIIVEVPSPTSWQFDFIAGLLIKATEAAGNKKTPRVQASVGEVISWRNIVWAITEGRRMAAGINQYLQAGKSAKAGR